ncbi:MAG TPA: hypothetical protein PKO33_00730 [Pyrinomonadaceae bacterium]|nr:hypothetical protein [Pyrinomonadaceae bacterium]
MKIVKKLNFVLLAITAISLFATACVDNKKIEEANKLVDSANKKVNDAKSMAAKADEAFTKVNEELDDYEESKTNNEAALKASMSDYDKAIELYKGASADFNSAAKLSDDASFKSYYEMSAKQIDNVSAVATQSKALTQAFVESKTIEEYSKKLDEIKAKVVSLKKEGDELTGKVNKLEEEVKAKSK